MSDDVVNYRQKVEDTIGAAAQPGAALAWAIVGLAEEINAGTTEIADALAGLGDNSPIGTDIERGLDGLGQQLQSGLESVAQGIGGLDR